MSISLPRRLRSPALALLLASSPLTALALQTIEARDGVSVEAKLSLREATRIKVDGTAITDVFGNIYSSNCGAGPTPPVQPGQPQPLAPQVNPSGEIVLECDRDKGEIYVKPVGASAKPINLFVSTNAATYTLILSRVDMPADTIVIKDRALRQASAAAERNNGRSPSHVRSLKQMLTIMADDSAPGDIQVRETNQVVQLWAESHFTLQRMYEGRGLIGERYLLTNISSQPMVVAEQEFDRAQGNVLAISIESHNLPPGESTNVFVIRQGN